jgi:hypothetical protein
MLAYKGSAVADDPVEVLEALLSRAKLGDIVGMTFAVSTRTNELEIGFVGAALEDPFEALGILSIMRSELADNIRRQLRIVRPKA